METSHSLLERVSRQSDPDSWQRLVEIYTPMLKAWLRRYAALSSADVDDLVQDVLLALARELPRFEHSRQPGAFRNWLRKILVNRLRHFWRAQQHRPETVGGSEFLQHVAQLEDQASGISQMWEREHDRQVMHRLLKMVEPQFAPKTWQAFWRQMLDGKPAQQVAEELGMPLHSVYAAKSRVLHALRELGGAMLD